MHVLVVGAGPVGLTAAIELTRLGHQVRIIDKNDGATKLSKAVAINAHSLDILAPSGVTTHFLNYGVKIKKAHIRIGQKPVVNVDFNHLAHRFNFLLAIPQDETEKLLQQRLHEMGVIVERNHELTQIQQNDQTVTATIAAHGATEDYTVDYLLGADGAHSATRKLMDIPFAGKSYPNNWNLADVRMQFPYESDHSINLFMFPKGKILFCVPLDYHRRYRIISNAEDPLQLLPKGSKLEERLWQSEFHINCRQVSSYQKGRVFLAGDAAHIHSPAGGRGMNLGMDDAVTFAQMLNEHTLSGYSENRHPIGAKVIHDTTQLFEMITLKNPLKCGLRNLLLRLLANRPSIQKKILPAMAGLK